MWSEPLNIDILFFSKRTWCLNNIFSSVVVILVNFPYRGRILAYIFGVWDIGDSLYTYRITLKILDSDKKSNRFQICLALTYLNVFRNHNCIAAKSFGKPLFGQTMNFWHLNSDIYLILRNPCYDVINQNKTKLFSLYD